MLLIPEPVSRNKPTAPDTVSFARPTVPFAVSSTISSTPPINFPVASTVLLNIPPAVLPNDTTAPGILVLVPEPP